jgi:hypothetical protein
MKRYQIPDARYQKGANLIFPLCPLESTFVDFVVKNKDLTTKEHKVNTKFHKEKQLIFSFCGLSTLDCGLNKQLK